MMGAIASRGNSFNQVHTCPFPSIHPYQFHLLLAALTVISLASLLKKARERQMEESTQGLNIVIRSWCQDRKWD